MSGGRAEIKILVEFELDDNASAKDMLVNGTTYEFHPTGLCGCVTSHKIVSVKQIKEKKDEHTDKNQASVKCKKRSGLSEREGLGQLNMFSQQTTSYFEPSDYSDEECDASGAGEERPDTRAGVDLLRVAPGTRGAPPIKIGLGKSCKNVGRFVPGSNWSFSEDGEDDNRSKAKSNADTDDHRRPISKGKGLKKPS